MNLKIYQAGNSANEIGTANIGDKIKFVLNLENAHSNVKFSPQNCYATNFLGNGRYNIIENG